MTYAANLLEEGINSQYLAVLKPRRFASSTWTLVAGTVYKQTFDYGEIDRVDFDGTEQTQASSAALSDGTWYYDPTNEVLYVDDGGDPSATDVVATYEIWVGTFDAHFNRDPLDASTREVYYEPVIVRAPSINQTSSGSLWGFMPTQSTGLTLSNLTHIFEKHIYSSSFNLADINVYHWLGGLETSNVKLVFRGVCRSLSYNDNQLTMSILDRNNIFGTEYRNAASDSFYNSTDFPNLDPVFINKPIRQVYGMLDGYRPVNVDYEADAPTTSTNRDWVCISDETNLGTVAATVAAAPASTTTRTYLDSADGLRIGDSVRLDKATDEYRTITDVNKTGTDYIEHATLSSGAAAPADTVDRSFVGSITIVQDNVVYEAQYIRDFTTYTDAPNSVAGFQFTSSLESNLSIPITLRPNDVVYCRVYGHKNTVTLGGGAFGSNSADTGNLSQGVVIIYDLLKSLGLAETDIDTVEFASLQASVDDQLGFAIPERSGGSFPKYKDLLTKLLLSLLFKIYFNDDGEWSVYAVGPVGAATKTIEDDEILETSIKYEFDYQDITSDIFIDYAGREFSLNHESGGGYSSVNSNSSNATRLHYVKRQATFRSYHFLDGEAQVLADRIRFALGERNGRLSINTKNRFFDTELGHVIDVIRDRMPGFEYENGTDRSREFTVLSTSKALTQINMELEDQKGIEDNSGSW